MNAMNLSLTESQLREIVAEAIIGKLDEATRKDIIQQAVGKMLTPEKQGYSYGSRDKSPLEVAFEQAVRTLTFEVTREYIADHPEVREQIQAAITAGIGKLISDHGRIRDAISAALASAIESEFSKD